VKLPFQIRAGRGKASPPSAAPSTHRQAASTARSPFPANPELGRFFIELRRALGISALQVATRLGTSERMVLALEAGYLGDLPPWPETVRIVSTYAQQAGIDPRPVLHVIANDLTRAATAVNRSTSAPAQRHPATAQSWSAGRPAEAADQPVRTRRIPGLVRLTNLAFRVRRGVTSLKLTSERPGSPAGVIGRRAKPRLKTLLAIATPAALWIFASETGILYRGAAHLPAPIARAARPVQDFLLLTFAPVRDGHRWIEVDDPRSRRAARLPVRQR